MICTADSFAEKMNKAKDWINFGFGLTIWATKSRPKVREVKPKAPFFDAVHFFHKAILAMNRDDF